MTTGQYKPIIDSVYFIIYIRLFSQRRSVKSYQKHIDQSLRHDVQRFGS